MSERVENISLILTYFDQIQGPITFLTIPDKINRKIADMVKNFMDLELNDSFFEIETKEKIAAKFVNKFIEIDSPDARGKKETLLITGVLPGGLNSLFIEFVFNTLSKKIHQLPNIHLAFYKENNSTSQTREKLSALKNALNESYNVLMQRYAQINLFNNVENPSEGFSWNQDKVNKTILKAFITAIDAQVPEGEVLLFDIGQMLGEKFEVMFVEDDVEGLLDQFSKFWKHNTLGEIDEIIIFDEKSLQLNVYECFECSHFPNIGKPVCKFDEGFLSRIISSKLKNPVSVKEIECFGTGKEFCQFEINVLDEEIVKKIKLQS